MDQQIAAVRAALAAVEPAIAQTEAALSIASAPQDIVALRAVLVDLKAERAKLQLQLANLEAAAVEVLPLARRRGRTMARRPAGRDVKKRTASQTKLKRIEKELKSTVRDRMFARVTIALATKVIRSARSMRALGNDVEPKPIKTKEKGLTQRRSG